MTTLLKDLTLLIYQYTKYRVYWKYLGVAGCSSVVDGEICSTSVVPKEITFSDKLINEIQDEIQEWYDNEADLSSV